jgi:hypothetical protein
MIKDKTELRKDGQRTIEGGMNSGRDPTLLSPQECSYSNNVTFRGGFPSNRQIFQKRTLTDGGGLADFQSGLVQGAAIYDIDDGQEYIMAMVSGGLYQITVASQGLTVQRTFGDGLSNASAPQCWFCQPDVYFVIQDGTSTPIIMQGLQTIRRAGTNEVPVGQSMAYGQGRLWLAQNRQVVAGDILGGPTSVISFTEQTYLSSGAYFGVPLTSGTIVGMTFVEQGDTATGQGELVIFARNAAYSIQAGVPRQAVSGVTPGWQGTPGMQKVALTNVGGTGWRNILNVNQDVFFRARDGWRTYRTARNEQYGWGGAPISKEMNRVMANDSLQLLDFASSALFKNRVLVTAEPLPYKSAGGASFGALVTLDLDVISSVINKSNLAYEFSPYFTQRGSPAYDGRWAMPDGYRILQILSGVFAHVERCFVFALNTATSLTEIWELLDGNFDAGQALISSQIETRAFDFKLPDALKMLRTAYLYFNTVLATTEVTVEFRSDGYMGWVFWDTFKITGQGVVSPPDSGTPPPSSLCNIPPCSVPGFCVPGPDPNTAASGGYWFKKGLPTPPAICDPIVGKLIRNGYYFQLRITWKGPSTLIMVLLHAEELVEDPNGGCP